MKASAADSGAGQLTAGRKSVPQESTKEFLFSMANLDGIVLYSPKNKLTEKLTEKVKRGVKIFEVMSFKFFGNRRRRRPDQKLGEKMKLPLKKSSKIIFGWFFFGGGSYFMKNQCNKKGL